MKRSDNRRRRLLRWLPALLLLLLASGPQGAQAQSQPSPQPPPLDSVSAPGILINEILAHTDPPQVDTVEFYNPTGAPISMAGWWFADGTQADDRVVLPATAIVPPGGYWLLELPEGTKPRLSEMGEKVTLTALDSNGAPTGYSDSVKFGASPNGVSLGRVVTSDGRDSLPAANAGDARQPATQGRASAPW